MKNTTFDGTEGDFITEMEARVMIENYKMGPAYNWNNMVVGHFFGRDIIEALLSDPNAKGIRFYYGAKPSMANNVLEPQLILVAADENAEDLIGPNKIADVSRPCPVFCPKTNGLALP